MDKILLIEDEKNVREPIRETLNLCNYDVIEAEHGKDGLEKAKQQLFDLVLCDVMMPQMNGLETLEAFQEDKDLRHIPFVFLSALSERNDIRQGMLRGAEDYITKPFNTNELLRVIELQLKKARNRSTKMIKVEESEELAKRKKDLNVLEAYLKSAGNVQNAILPSEREINNSFPDNFVFFRPKYDVSGDFYWMKDFGDKKLISVIDCTGHGMSASLLSMCYYTSLNQAVKQKKLKSPKDIFEWVIHNVQDYLSEHDSVAHDSGMDGLICEIDYTQNKIRYVGAKRPLFFLSNQALEISDEDFKISHSFGNKKLNRIKAGNRYLNVNEKEIPLLQREFTYQEGDAIYLSSDGFEDQFGGDNDKRFKTGNFMKLLESVQNESTSDQKSILINAFDNWKEGYQQIDDVTVVGVKL
ncbi:MAG: response regulator [Vicingaceae bacterium]